MRPVLLACALGLSASTVHAAEPPPASPKEHPSVHVPVNLHVGPALLLTNIDTGAGFFLGADVSILGSVAPVLDLGARLFVNGGQVPICSDGDGGYSLGTVMMCRARSIWWDWGQRFDWTLWTGAHFAMSFDLGDRVRLRPSAGLVFMPMLHYYVPLPGLALYLDVALWRNEAARLFAGLATHAQVWSITLMGLAPSLTLEL